MDLSHKNASKSTSRQSTNNFGFLVKTGTNELFRYKDGIGTMYQYQTPKIEDSIDLFEEIRKILSMKGSRELVIEI